MVSVFSGFGSCNSRARSIKTRIETVLMNFLQLKRKKIREQDPLKQGLKQITFSNKNRFSCIREQDPLKQGLKPLLQYIERFPRNSRARSIKTRIETEKQDQGDIGFIPDSRARSIKTRIETKYMMFGTGSTTILFASKIH